MRTNVGDKLILLVLDLSKESLLISGNLGLPGLQLDLGCGPPLLGDLLVCLGLGGRVGTDGSVGLMVHTLNTVRGHTQLDVPGIGWNCLKVEQFKIKSKIEITTF